MLIPLNGVIIEYEYVILVSFSSKWNHIIEYELDFLLKQKWLPKMFWIIGFCQLIAAILPK